jgi:hypothetical protein
LVRSLLVLRCSKEQNALHTLIHQRHLTPLCGGRAPTAERTLAPARMVSESLTPRPELENDQDPLRNSAVSADCGAALPRRWQRNAGALALGDPEGYPTWHDLDARPGPVQVRHALRPGESWNSVRHGTALAAHIGPLVLAPSSRRALRPDPDHGPGAASISHSISTPSRRMRRPCSRRCSRTAPLRQPTRRPWPR